MNIRNVLSISLFSLSALAYACSDEDPAATVAPTPDAGTSGDDAPPPPPGPPADAGDDAPSARPVTLTFEGRVGAEAFACGKTFTGLGTSAATATAGDFRFFVHDVKLLRGTEEVPVTLDAKAPWQNARVALLDFEDNSGECENGTAGTNGVVTGTVVGEGFDGIAFTVGVPEALNHRNKDTEEPPLPASGMQWNWTTGFKHVSFEVRSTTMVGDTRVPRFFAHIGSTMCTGNPADGGTASCTRKNRPEVRLTGFDPTKHKIVVDGEKLLEASDIDVNGGGMPGCMSGPTDPDCPPIFPKIGLDFETGAVTGPSPIFSSEGK